jgi:hypothetical protein
MGKRGDIMNHTQPIRTFVAATTLAAAAAAGFAAFGSHSLHPYLGLAVLALAAVTSRIKVKLPGIDGNMSVNLPFLLTAIVSLSSAEAVVITCVSTAVQCWPRRDSKFNPQQMEFNLSMMAFASATASLMFHSAWLRQWTPGPGCLALAAATLFLGQTVPVAAIISLSENKSIAEVWWKLAHLSFPYYVLSAGVSVMVQTVSARLGWELALGVFPVMYGIHRSYRIYFERIAETPRVPAPAPVLVRAARAGA